MSHYAFQLKKCLEENCAYCQLNPPRLLPEEFAELHFLPDPVPDTQTGRYQSFDQVCFFFFFFDKVEFFLSMNTLEFC